MAMTNKEFYNRKPLCDALAKFTADSDIGLAPNGFRAWLEAAWHDPTESGRMVRGKWYTDAAIDAKIREMESKPVTGYLLEFKAEGEADYKPSEFATAMISNYYTKLFDGQPEQDEWYFGEIVVGYFADMPAVWLDDGTTWGERCGVDFDPRTTPIKEPSANGTWAGECAKGTWLTPTKWRVRKTMVNGRLSDRARQYFRKFPNIYMKHEEK